MGNVIIPMAEAYTSPLSRVRHFKRSADVTLVRVMSLHQAGTTVTVTKEFQGAWKVRDTVAALSLIVTSVRTGALFTEEFHTVHVVPTLLHFLTTLAAWVSVTRKFDTDQNLLALSLSEQLKCKIA